VARLRTGRFGRLPRAAPDISGAIAAMLREAQAQMDSNMVDAWRNGGKVDGRGVDDNALLAYFRKRRDAIDPSDPLWAEWDNRVTQYTFAIEESKMALANDEGKVSDAAMAAFYRKWAAKATPNSEFQRTLLDKAAKWNAGAKAAGGRKRAGNKAAAHAKWAEGIHTSMVAPGEILTSGLLAIAIQYGAAPAGDPVTGEGRAKSLTNIFPTSAAYGDFISSLDGKVDDPAVQSIIDAVVAQMPKGFRFNASNINAVFQKADRGHLLLINGSTTKTEKKDWTKRRVAMQLDDIRVRQAPVNEAVEKELDDFGARTDLCDGNPYCAAHEASVTLDRLLPYMPLIVASARGPVTLETQNTGFAAMYGATVRKLTDIKNMKPLLPTAAAELGKNAKPGAEGAVADDYDLFDGAAGNSKPKGFLDDWGNDVNSQRQMLDAGGWVSTVLATQGGQPVLNPDGSPHYNYVVHPATEVPPLDMVPLHASSELFVDDSRTLPPTYYAQAPRPITISPTVWAFPAPANVVYMGPTGEIVPHEGVTAVVGAVPATQLPWVEFQGLKGPDGNTYTEYRMGNGTPASPYVFAIYNPAEVTTPAARNGAPVLQVQMVPDVKGVPQPQVDIQPLLDGVALATHETKSGFLPIGSYKTTGAGVVAMSINNLIATEGIGPTVIAKANGWIGDWEDGMYKQPLDNPDRVNMSHDSFELRANLRLQAQGMERKHLTDAYSTMTNSNDPTDLPYRNALTLAGFDKYGEDEVGRRITLLKGIDKVEADIAAQREKANTDVGLMPWDIQRQRNVIEVLAGERVYIDQQRANVLNPNISVSAIKIPGVPTMFQPQPTPAPGFGIGGYVFGQQQPGPPIPAPATVPLPTPPPPPQDESTRPQEPPTTVGIPPPVTLVPPQVTNTMLALGQHTPGPAGYGAAAQAVAPAVQPKAAVKLPRATYSPQTGPHINAPLE
jgi:hypothetical protein